MKLKTVKKLRLILPSAALAILLLGKLFSKTATRFAIVCLVLGLFLVIANIIIILLYYKCPWCKRLLPSRGIVVEYCPYCGAPLNDE